MLIDGTVEIETIATADAVQVPLPDKTEYVVVVVGDTVTEADAGGLDPELAVHVNGPAPLEVNVTLCPAQIVESDGVIAIDGVAEIDTVATAEDVQVPEPTKTEYVVVIVGETVTVATDGGLEPELAVHAYGPAPPEVNTTLCPAHIVDREGVIATVPAEFTLTVITEKLVQVPLVLVTVYVVVAVGVVTTTEPVGELKPVPGTQE